MNSSEHIEIPQNATWERGWPMACWDVDGVPHGVTLTGYTIRSQVRLYAEATTVLHEWSTATANAWVESRQVSAWDRERRRRYTITTDVVVLHVEPEDSLTWTWEQGVWDIKIYSPGNNPWEDRIAGGTVTVIAAVTRP